MWRAWPGWQIEQDRRNSEAVSQERSRLRNFIRRRVPDPRDAEDILQDVFCELADANRLLMPIEHVTAGCFAWRAIASPIFFVRRNRKAFPMPRTKTRTANGCSWKICCLPPKPDRKRFTHAACFFEEIELAIEELSSTQREVFDAHEFGRGAASGRSPSNRRGA